MLIGVYSNGECIKKYEMNEQATHALPKVFRDIFDDFECSRLFYTKGPGSYMSIKASYIFLKTLEVTLDIPFFACDGFSFNQNSPIKSIGNKWFVKNNNIINIVSERFLHVRNFELPIFLDIDIFSKDTQPLYILPAV